MAERIAGGQINICQGGSKVLGPNFHEAHTKVIFCDPQRDPYLNGAFKTGVT